MAGSATQGERIAAKGAVMGGVATKAPTTRVGTVALVSMVKFLRLLKMHLAKGRKKTRTTVANGSRNKNPKIVGWHVQD